MSFEAMLTNWRSVRNRQRLETPLVCRPSGYSLEMNGSPSAAVLIAMAIAASALGLAACTGATVTETTCGQTPASAMATRGSLEVRELRRNVVTIIRNSETASQSLPTSEAEGQTSVLTAIADNLSSMASKLAALTYPPQYQAAEQAFVTQLQSQAALLRSGQTGIESGSAEATTNDLRRFYDALGIPSVCTTTTSR